uniref:Predicted protein n=1 Tax=Hordeum vulgare subsp. vulgare TaxID=112509 RepID=F2E3C0_HORVV|nr:predicted protein [Hordeum vulgare subsp. vulgare]
MHPLQPSPPQSQPCCRPHPDNLRRPPSTHPLTPSPPPPQPCRRRPPSTHPILPSPPRSTTTALLSPLHRPPPLSPPTIHASAGKHRRPQPSHCRRPFSTHPQPSSPPTTPLPLIVVEEDECFRN